MTVEIRPLPRGSGFVFSQRVVGGAVPKQWIPAVEQGVRDGLEKGQLGFPVTDLEVTLIDGQTHSVDSSEMAFRMAGRLAMEEGLPGCGAILLEPIEKLTVYSPSPSASNVTSALTARRGQILGLAPREDWRGWERIEAYLPQSERQGLIAELRGLTQGLGAFEADFDHMAELTGRLATEASEGQARGRTPDAPKPPSVFGGPSLGGGTALPLCQARDHAAQSGERNHDRSRRRACRQDQHRQAGDDLARRVQHRMVRLLHLRHGRGAGVPQAVLRRRACRRRWRSSPPFPPSRSASSPGRWAG